MEFKITGVVREKESKRPVPGLLVRAFDKDLFYDDLLGNAITGSDGTFSIGYEGKDFQELFEKRPDIYFVIYGSATARDPGRAGDKPIYTTGVRFKAGLREHFLIEIPHEQLYGIVPSPEPGEWKKLIDEYIRTHPVDFQYDPDKGFAVPRLECTDWDTTELRAVRPHIGESAWLTVMVANRGNGASYSAYVQLWEGPFGYDVPWRDRRLCDFRILTINPGQTVPVRLCYTRQRESCMFDVVCFDPFLDPRPPSPLQYDRHTIGAAIFADTLPP